MIENEREARLLPVAPRPKTVPHEREKTKYEKKNDRTEGNNGCLGDKNSHKLIENAGPQDLNPLSRRKNVHRRKKNASHEEKNRRNEEENVRKRGEIGRRSEKIRQPQADGFALPEKKGWGNT